MFSSSSSFEDRACAPQAANDENNVYTNEKTTRKMPRQRRQIEVIKDSSGL